MWNKNEMADQSLIKFVESPAFQDFSILMDEYARAKFLDNMKNPDEKNHHDLISDQKMLNFYISFPDFLKKKAKFATEKATEEMNNKIADSKK